MKRRTLILALPVVLVALPMRADDKPTPAVPATPAAPAATAPATASPFDKWEKEIAAMEAADKKSPPPKGAVLFIGSSGIRMWKTLADDFPGHQMINRGFGGSEMADSTHFADRIVIPAAPAAILVQAGGNDIHNNKSPEVVAADFKAFVAKVTAALPEVRIAYLSIAPSIARWAEREKEQAASKLVSEFIATHKNCTYIECWDQFLGADGLPRAELYIDDKLHNNAEGYKVRAAIVRPFVESVKE